MIDSFKNKETLKIWNGEFTNKLPNQLHKIALRKLRMLNASTQLWDLKVPPNNKLEALKGDLIGSHSIRINQQYRIIFKWDKKTNSAYDVYIDDYH